jgi:hypothetical protein
MFVEFMVMFFKMQTLMEGICAALRTIGSHVRRRGE